MCDSLQHLLDHARDICDGVRQIDGDIEGLRLGGGTALMLHIDHRESHDIDLFLPSRESLGFIIAVVNDWEVFHDEARCETDGSLYVKIEIRDRGEIYCIAAPPITNDPPVSMTIGNHSLLVDTVPEIIASKVVHRGTFLKPRDIFDIMAASKAGYQDCIQKVLSGLTPYVRSSLDHIEKLVSRNTTLFMEELVIRPDYQDLVDQALPSVRTILNTALQDAERSSNENNDSAFSSPHDISDLPRSPSKSPS